MSSGGIYVNYGDYYVGNSYGQPDYWWLRSPHTNGSSHAYYVYLNGYINYDDYYDYGDVYNSYGNIFSV